MSRAIKKVGTALRTAMMLMMMMRGRISRAEPIMTDPNRCVDLDPEWKCCPPPTNEKIVDFKPQPQTARIRRPAHSLDQEAARKYEKAVAMMRALPDDHPWNFIQQAKVHCSYCSGGHLQLGLNVSIEIHGSWHFFTWHRAYLYFYERILGKLIDEPSFALPFWNWDDPAGMKIPTIYTESSSSLFNPTRYPAALRLIDLSGRCHASSLAMQKQCNLHLMRRRFDAGMNSSLLFYGSPYKSGDPGYPGSGIVENIPHGPVHMHTGFDMSNIMRAAQDPIFLAHHANIDRLWTIWENISGDEAFLNDKDFLDASFLFWDENMQRVRIHVRDLIDRRTLGYEYESVPIRWMSIRTSSAALPINANNQSAWKPVFPFALHSSITIVVARKAGSEKEMIEVSGIELDGRDFVWFCVKLAKKNSDRVMEVGSFFHMNRTAKVKIPIVTKLWIRIASFVKEIDAAADEVVEVILTPINGGDKVNIGGVTIV